MGSAARGTSPAGSGEVGLASPLLSGGAGALPRATEPERPTRRPDTAASELAGRIRLQTAFRLAIAVALLASTAAIEWRAGPGLSRVYDFGPLYWLTSFVFATSIPAVLGARRIRSVRRLTALAVWQFLADIGVTTVLVHLTGGVDSVFTFLYLLTILNASAVLFRRGAYLTAAASSIAYGLLIDLSYFGFVKPFAPLLLGGGDVTSREALFRVSVHVVAFLLTASLASYLSDLLRRTGQELQEAALDLRELQALTKHIVENIASGLLTVDRSGRVTSFNRTAQEITGRPLAGVFGTNIAQVFPGVAERISSPSDLRRHEEGYVRPDGRALVLGFSYSPLRNDEGVEIGTIVIFQDLTELREMETRLKREERLAAIGRLAAGIAHEIRNPLASISGSIEMLRSSLRPGVDDARLMEIILRETDRLDGLITEFLDYVKPLRRNPSDVDLHSVLVETVEALSATDAGRGVRFDLPAAEVVGTVRGDRDHLKQVVWNLLLNAAQAMGGTGAVTVRVEGPRTADTLVFEIEDQGPGIPEASLPHVFEPFFTTKERGTGLGLAMVHKIVEAHRGTIELASRPGEGARFRLTLPRRDLPSPP